MKTSSIISGFTDEVSDDLELQIEALKELGWRHIDLRTVAGKNVAALSDDEFDLVFNTLGENDIDIACFGSTVANWGRDAEKDFELDLSEMKTSIRHMNKAGVRHIRIMSYRVSEPVELGSELETAVIANIRKIVKLAEDHGVVCLHENCQTWGGQSFQHCLRLLEEVDSPALRLIFDTGNPVGMLDVRGNKPYDLQDPLLFFQQVQEYVDYLHIKDAVIRDGRVDYVFPGQGLGRVREILDIVGRGPVALPISIEPHVSVVFHDPSVQAPFAERWQNFIDYGNQLVRMAEEAGILFSISRNH